LKASKVEKTGGLAVRVMCGGRLGYSASSDETAIEKLAANALESALYGEQIQLSFASAQPAAEVTCLDPRILDLPVARLVEMGQEIIDLLLESTPDLQVNVGIRRSLQRLTIYSQDDSQVSVVRSPLSITIEGTRIQENDVLILDAEGGWTTWDDDFLAQARALADKFERSCNLTTIHSGRMPVLFSPSGALSLALPLQAGVDGRSVYKRASPLVGKIGQDLLDPKITLVDDATLDGQFASAPYDDEGIPHRRNVLFERGTLGGFLYDLKTAAQAGTVSTGNGTRRLFEPPRPWPTSLLLEAGEVPQADLLGSIQRGLLVDDVLGLGQGNILSGAFSNPVNLGFKIENGEVVGRVKNTAIAGNVYDLLRNVAGVSRERRWVYSTFCLPYLLLPELNIVAQA
jgi:PmbA protein